MISPFHRLVNRSVCIMWFKRHPNEIRFAPKVRFVTRSARDEGAKRLIRDFSCEAGSKRAVISLAIGYETREPAVDRGSGCTYNITVAFGGSKMTVLSLPSRYALGSLCSGVSLRGKKRKADPADQICEKTVPSRGYWCISDTIS